eukprot:scaffold898_cov229-Pinguiococcus_pyrenoidosus.AAC.14
MRVRCGKFKSSAGKHNLKPQSGAIGPAEIASERRSRASAKLATSHFPLRTIWQVSYSVFSIRGAAHRWRRARNEACVARKRLTRRYPPRQALGVR